MTETNQEFDMSTTMNDDDTVTSDGLADVLERVEKLENQVNHITEQHAEITHQLNEHADALEEVGESVGEIEEIVDEINDRQDLAESRINGLTSSIDSVEEELQEIHGEMDDTANALQRRLTAVENTLDLDERDIAKAVKPDACELEQLAMLSNEEELKIRTKRAISVFEQFHDIATNIQSGGKRLLSKDVKMFLSGQSLSGQSSSGIAYAQVQRVIDTFVEKTDEHYESIQTSDGRAIIWHPETE